MAVRRRELASSLSSKVIEYVCGLGHTQADVARMLNVSEGYVSLVRSGDRGLTVDHLEKLSEALAIPLGAMLVAVTEPPKEWNGSPEMRELLSRFKTAMRHADLMEQAMSRRTATSR